MLGIFHAWSLQLSMKRAQRFASAVVSVAGATRMNKAFYEPFIETWFSGTNL
jgi:fructokinase